MYIKECKNINFRRKAIEVYKKEKTTSVVHVSLKFFFRLDVIQPLTAENSTPSRLPPSLPPAADVITSCDMSSSLQTPKHDSPLIRPDGVWMHGDSLWATIAHVRQSGEWLTDGWAHPTREWGGADDGSWPPACVVCIRTPTETNTQEIARSHFDLHVNSPPEVVIS